MSESQNIGTGTYRNTFVKGIYGTPNPYNRNQEIFISFQGRDNYIDKGQWKVLIHPKQIVSGVVDAYLPIRASLTGNVEFLNPTEFGTLTIPSTAEGLITVAAYDQNVDDFAYFPDGVIQQMIRLNRILLHPVWIFILHIREMIIPLRREHLWRYHLYPVLHVC